jgi:hypothetical protein
MTKRKRIVNVDKLLKERGAGRGVEYKPWIKIQDVPSLGRATRLKGIKTQRQHEFLSDLERNYFYFLEYSDEVIDIREQYPLLPLEETVMIANELGINHPKNPKTGEYIVMTTDFFITKSNMVDVARTIKQKDDLLNKRIIEKFEIERQYWKKKNIDWGIVTEEEIDKTIAHNISFVHNYYNITEMDSFQKFGDKDLEDLTLEYTKRIIDTTKSIRSISKIFDTDMALDNGSGIAIFRYLIARKLIQVDLSKPLSVDEKININWVKEDLKREQNVL